MLLLRNQKNLKQNNQPQILNFCDLKTYNHQNGLPRKYYDLQKENLFYKPNYQPELYIIKLRMKDEISAAVTFLIRIISCSNTQLSKKQILDLQDKITELLTIKFHNHWHPDRPSRGQAFRCIRVNGLSRNDSILESACQSIGIIYDDLRFPIELTLWIDPEEVTCRFGEHKGSYCILAKFKGGNKENYINQININELEQKSIERQRQRSYELMNSRKKRNNKSIFNKNNNVLTTMHTNFTNNVYDAYGSSPNVSFNVYSSNPKYSTSPPQQQLNRQNSSGLFSPNRISNYRNNTNISTTITANTSFSNINSLNNKLFVRNLQSSFTSSGTNSMNGSLSFDATYASNNRYHFMNKSIVKA